MIYDYIYTKRYETISQAERAVHIGLIQLTASHMISLMPATLTNTASFGIDLNNYMNQGQGRVNQGYDSNISTGSDNRIDEELKRSKLDDVGVSYRYTFFLI